MRVNFTKKQFKNLIYLCALGAQIIQNSEEEIKNKEKIEVLEYILSYYKDDVELDLSNTKNLEDVVEKIIGSSSALEECIDNYNENTFWSILSAKMASRDIMDELDNCIEEGKNYAEYIDKRKKLQRRYLREFKRGNYENDNLPY